MKVAEYHDFVCRTDQYAKRMQNERRAIALYGLVGEIGSLVSAVKKKILGEDGSDVAWDHPTEEIKEEIGDVLWYCQSLAQAVNGEAFDILANGINLLAQEIGAPNDRAESIRACLGSIKKDEFLSAARNFPPPNECSFDEYQHLAFKTARTDERTLLKVCLALLSQLAAELLRATLPDIELKLNKNIADRPANTVLGEIVWHLAAIASLYNLSLDEIVAFNIKKVGFREKGAQTPLHDEGIEKQQQFPRNFSVAFVCIEKGRSRMYLDGRKLGDDITDNALKDDGYRFHDVLHLAFIAHLGWSPVVRGMLRKKRPDVDLVQDGGRAKVVEELVINAIHSEAIRQASADGRCSTDGPVHLFRDASAIPFSLLKTLRTWVDGLEVHKNAYWEWQNAICDGYNIFFELRKHNQGTVHLDLEQRKIEFSPTVSPNVSGITVGLGMGAATNHSNDGISNVLSNSEIDSARSSEGLARTLAAKRALFSALNLPIEPEASWNQIELRVLDDNKISVAPSGEAQNQIWKMRVVDYKVAFVVNTEQTLCTVVAIADANDLSR